MGEVKVKFEFDDSVMAKVLYVSAVIVLGLMVYVAVFYPFLSVDEWFTKGLLSYSAIDQIRITAIDVHPPLYYMILNAFVKTLAALHINLDLIVSLKIVSVIPYFIVLGLSLTRVRKRYGELTGGLFAFSLIAMSTFFTQYLTARMYSWALLFIVAGFLCVRPILEDNNLKHWILLSVFAALGAYTHYFTAIAFISLYVILFSYILIKRREFIRNWILSSAVGIVLYVPWILKLLRQVSKVESDYWIPQVDLKTVLDCVSSVLFVDMSTFISLAVFIVLMVFVALILRDFIKNRSADDEYMLMGILTFFITILVGCVISLISQPILRIRYVAPVSALIWILISIYIGKIDLKKAAVVLSVALLIVGAANVCVQMDEIHEFHDKTFKDLNTLSKLNKNDTIIIFEGMQKYFRFNEELNNTKMFCSYELNNKSIQQNYAKILNLGDDVFKIPYDIDKYPESKVYYIHDHKSNMTPVDGYNFTDKYRVQNSKVTRIS